MPHDSAYTVDSLRLKLSAILASQRLPVHVVAHGPHYTPDEKGKQGIVPHARRWRVAFRTRK
jgi:hypothetical protein